MSENFLSGNLVNPDSMRQLENMVGSVEGVGKALEGALSRIESSEPSRRQFLALSASALTLLTLDMLTKGCVPAVTLNETKQDVMGINWDCNQIIPIPKNGCYIGTNWQLYEKEIKEYFESRYGKAPTFHALGRGTWVEAFYKDRTKFLIDDGIIPVIRYVPYSFRDSYKPLIKGKFDDELKEFAYQAAKFEYPIVLLPFQMPNMAGSHKHNWPWAGHSSSQYKEAWVRMHEIFEKEGANNNTVWSLKLMVGRWDRWGYPDPFKYIPPEENFDYIGWVTNNVGGRSSTPFNSLFWSYYAKGADRYRRKPQIIWELSSPYGFSQAGWMDDALTQIPNKYPRIKGVNLDENSSAGYNPHPTEATQKVIKRHFSDSYFIGSIIGKK